MNKLIIIFCALALTSANVFAQGCLPEGITFNYQYQIDNFQSSYPGCTEIEGDVSINSSDITNFNGLSVVTSIGGNLLIFFNPYLLNLEGLNNLNYVGGYIEIWANDNLTSLSGLNGLTELGGSLIIDNYPLLCLEGLEALTTVGGILRIKSNSLITNLNGLNGLVTIGTGIYMESNDNLIDLSGLNSLAFVGGDVDIIYNYSLQNFIGLENLTNVYGALDISYNHSLNNLTALHNLTSIGGTLWITDNPYLMSLQGIENIDHNSIIDLNIYNNPLLNDCDVQSICDYLVAPNGIVEIHNNAPGCNSQEEVEAACLNSLEEKIFNQEITIYPNPATSFITFNVNDCLPIDEAVIYNHLGQKALEAVPVNNTVDVSTLKPGIYFLEVITNETRTRIKLVIE
jgi:hypothetical protein